MRLGGQQDKLERTPSWSQTNRLPHSHPRTRSRLWEVSEFWGSGLYNERITPTSWAPGGTVNEMMFIRHLTCNHVSVFFLPFLLTHPFLFLLPHFHLPFPQPGLHTWLRGPLSLSLACPAIFPGSCEPRFLRNLYKLRCSPSER